MIYLADPALGLTIYAFFDDGRLQIIGLHGTAVR